MNKAIKKYIAVFLLALFVFPYIQRDIHDFAHDADFHCINRTEKHFHPIEHHCSICDEIFFVLDSPQYFTEIKPLLQVFLIVKQFATCEFEGQTIRSRYLRGPPLF